MKHFKKTILLFALISSNIFIWAQSGPSYGIKAGLNYNANGDYFESIQAASDNPDRNIGFHIGIFGKLGNDLYFRPELVYTNTKSDYTASDFKMQKIDAPLLVGVKILGPFSLFGGPSFQYILDSEFDGISINDIDNDISVGLNFGAAINFKKFAVDLRYERGFSNNEAQFLSNNNIDTSRIDTRPDQLILSVSVVL
jgi:hypothetical protein